MIRILAIPSLAISLLMPAIHCLAQKADTMTTTLHISQDIRVDVLLNKHIQVNENKKTTEGFRVQIFFDSGNNSKTRAQTVSDEFVAKYPKSGAYLSFKTPNYRVRVGDFRTRLDAQRFLNEIIADYPNAFIISDQINLPNEEP
jgi:hypothetical protein